MNMENPSNTNEVQRDASSGRSGPSVTLIALAVVIVLFVVFFLQNSEPLIIDFLVFEKRTTIRWALLVAVVLGILFDRIITIVWRRWRRRNNE
jgi:uncharacterized integral membrane protein